MQTKKKICVFGDVMLDTWVRCSPVKVSQEAPVLVCHYEGETYSPGGAANVAANLVRGYDADVRLVGFWANDARLKYLIDTLVAYSIDTRHMVVLPGWSTIEKRRFVDLLNRQLLRLDTEVANPVIPDPIQQALKDQLTAASRDCDSLVISDYGKGTVTAELARYAIQAFRDRGKYVIVNGKPEKFLNYRGASVLVYNLAEAQAAWQRCGNGREIEETHGLAQALFFLLNAGQARTDVLITCGDRGMVLVAADGGIQLIAAVPADVANTTGAGDVVIATIAANGCHDVGVLNDAAHNAAIAIATHGTSICPRKELG